MAIEFPVLLPPDDLELPTDGSEEPLSPARCVLLGHNVAPDGKSNPIDFDDQHFMFLYQHADMFFLVRGLNPEMMSGAQISARDAENLLARLPYRVS